MMTYHERIEYLRNQKSLQTQEKMRKWGYMNEDDYGNVVPPEDYHFEVEYNDTENKTFYGAAAWAKNFKRLLETHPVFVEPQDALAGKWMMILQRMRPFESAVSFRNMEMAPIFSYEDLKSEQEKYGIVSGIGKMHHFAPDFQIGLSLGWDGIRNKIEVYKKIHRDEEARELYEAEPLVLDGIALWMTHTTEEIARQKKNQTDPEMREHLCKLERMNRKLIHDPPETFHEACQYLVWINMLNRTYNRAGAGCQLDVILLPYYLKDIQKGILSREEAEFILACLLMNDPQYYQIGGPDEDGNDVTNELSYLILEAAHLAKTTINLTIRVNRDIPERLLRRGIEILLEDKKAYPRFSGSETLVEGFMRSGYPASLARKRIAVGCHWTSLPGLEYTLNDLIKINFAKVFEVAFREYGREPGSPTTEGLYEVFLRHLSKAVLCVAKGIDFHLSHQYLNAPELMLNLLCHGPIERGRDASHGGMPYYNIGVDGAALATVADSFGALEQRVEKERKLTWQECWEAVESNFAGPQGERIRSLLSSSERFGRGGSCGDRWASRISSDFSRMVAENPTPDGWKMIPGLFSWANTINLGEKVGATPNGRLAGNPISHGANPDPGFRKDGAVTAIAKAVAQIQCGYGNTAPLQLELNPTIESGEKGVRILEAVIRSHFDLGGTLININVVRKEDILDAYDHPEKYPDLIVRVTGFTAYFAALSPEFRELVIQRILTE